jgi:hypothetical protein
MTVLGIILLVAILLAVIALVAVAVVATLGLDADQARLKKSLRWAGAVLCITAGFLDHWSYVLLGAAWLGLIASPSEPAPLRATCRQVP